MHNKEVCFLSSIQQGSCHSLCLFYHNYKVGQFSN